MEGSVTARSADHATPHVAGAFACFGERWQIACDDPALARFLGELYAPMLNDSRGGDPVVTYRLTTASGGGSGEVHRDDELLVRSPRPSRLLGKLVWAINRQVIDASGARLLLHAAAAADPHGRSVLLPAPMESGKTTLVTGLLDRGLAYLTDEAVVVEPDLSLHGFRKPLSIDKGSWGVLGHHRPVLATGLSAYLDDQWQVAPHRFASVAPRGVLAAIVFPSYRAGQATALERLHPVSALDLARASAFGEPGRPLSAEKMAQLAHVVTSVPCFSLRFSDLSEACSDVLEVLGQGGRGTDHG